MPWIMKFTGTATANGNVGGTTVIDTLPHPPATVLELDGYYVNMYMKITSGPYTNQIRLITNWVKATGTFTVASSFGGQITTGTTYEVSVTLPFDPGKVEDTWPVEKTGAKMPGDLPYLIMFGDKERKLKIEGYIYEPGKTIAQLKASYIEPLRKLRHRVVILTTPDGLYDGTMAVDEFKTLHEYKVLNAIKFTMLFAQGSAYVVL